jgi:ABC-type sulfate transport system permease component
MSAATILALRGVICLALAGSLFAQFFIAPVMWLDFDPERNDVRFPLVAIFVLLVLTMQVTAVAIWRLLTMVRRGTVFSDAWSRAAFRYVDVVIAAVSTAAALVLGLAVLAAYSNRTTPGDEVAPGLVGLVMVFGLAVGGVALIVVVLRALLTQAVARDTEARHLQAELDEVI